MYEGAESEQDYEEPDYPDYFEDGNSDYFQEDQDEDATVQKNSQHSPREIAKFPTEVSLDDLKFSMNNYGVYNLVNTAYCADDGDWKLDYLRDEFKKIDAELEKRNFDFGTVEQLNQDLHNGKLVKCPDDICEAVDHAMREVIMHIYNTGENIDNITKFVENWDPRILTMKQSPFGAAELSDQLAWALVEDQTSPVPVAYDETDYQNNPVLDDAVQKWESEVDKYDFSSLDEPNNLSQEQHRSSEMLNLHDLMNADSRKDAITAMTKFFLKNGMDLNQIDDVLSDVKMTALFQAVELGKEDSSLGVSRDNGR